jgi:small subunit ribosomal protein S8
MDPISDMLTRIRNAYAAKKTEVLVPYSKLKHNLAKVLMQESWIKDMEVKSEGTLKDLLLQLRYENGEPVISGIKRVSRPGQRIYTKNDSIPSVRGGMGTTIISTSRGLMPDRMARKEKVGGEIICQIW